MLRRVASDDGTTHTVYVQNGRQTVAEYGYGVAPASETFNYVWGSYIDEPVVRTGAAGNRYDHRNQQYSIIGLTDASGRLKEQYTYNAYGGLTVLDGSGAAVTGVGESNRYTYTGREWDRAVGLYHNRARMYDPNAGRFCSRDPIGYKDAINAYQILRSRTIILRDPSGKGCAISLTGAQLMETLYEEDDPDDVVACIYRFKFDLAMIDTARRLRLHTPKIIANADANA